jgi:hypothetical protein
MWAHRRLPVRQPTRAASSRSTVRAPTSSAPATSSTTSTSPRPATARSWPGSPPSRTPAARTRKAGVIWKASTVAGSPYILIETGPTGIVKVQYNFSGSVSGATYSFPNVWMKLSPIGHATSRPHSQPDGVTWTVVLSKSLPTIPAASTVGVVECSHKVGVLGTATFDNISFTPGP